jgi:hypothetical protein
MNDNIKQELTMNQKKWVEALRSGEYKQGKRALCKEGNFCCLGVAAELFKTEDTVIITSKVKSVDNLGEPIYINLTSYDNSDSCAPNYVVKALALHSDTGGVNDATVTALTQENDMGATFEEIANLIESNPQHYFK